MSQQIDHTTPAGPATSAAQPPERAPRPLHLSTLTVRALVAELSEAEDALRDLEPFVVRHGRLVVNPARAPWITRERALVAELRSRHTAWRRGALPGLLATPASSPPRTAAGAERTVSGV